MKRREFIINSTLAIAGTMLLTGCGIQDVQAAKEQVKRRKYKNLSLPLLALGCMRFPTTKTGAIDQKQVEEMVQYAMEHGVNYFDTAYPYHGGKSEIAIGKALKKYNRKSFFLADKSPARMMRSKEDVHRIFEEQLKKCQTDYFDFYMVHNINENTIKAYRDNDMFNELLKHKKEGRIKNLGFSFHGTPDMLKEIVKEHDWDFAQLQINYLDWEVINAKEQYEIATKAGLSVIVMEPLRGGSLCKLPKKAAAALKAACPTETQPSFALRWIAKKDKVMTLLSGMSNMEQLQENVQTFVDYKPMSETEEKTAEKVSKLIQSAGAISCTACKYCMEVCPQGINIPAIFSLYNDFKRSGDKNTFKFRYSVLNEDERADKCISCGLCNRNCPQSLDIPKLLKQITKEV